MTDRQKQILNDVGFAVAEFSCGVVMGIAICVAKTGAPFKMGPITIAKKEAK